MNEKMCIRDRLWLQGRGYFTAPGVTGEGQEMLGQGIYQSANAGETNENSQ